VEIVMTENPKTPAKKTIQDPPEYAAAGGESNSWSGRGKPPEQPSGGTEAAPSEAVPSEAPHVASGGIGGEKEAAPSSSDVSVTGFGGEREATYQQNGQSEVTPASNNTKGRIETIRQRHEWWDKPEPEAQEGIARNPQRSEPPAPEEGAQGEGARNPQTGERIARNPQTGE
jgi:hypothetical protein